jgi:hypothetical protein
MIFRTVRVHAQGQELKASVPAADAIDPKFFDQVAQIAHIATTFGIAYVAVTKFGWWGLLVATVGILIYASWHEFIHDPEKENAATRGSDLEDFLFLVGGPVLAAIVHAL